MPIDRLHCWCIRCEKITRLEISEIAFIDDSGVYEGRDLKCGSCGSTLLSLLLERRLNGHDRS